MSDTAAWVVGGVVVAAGIGGAVYVWTQRKARVDESEPPAQVSTPAQPVTQAPPSKPPAQTPAGPSPADVVGTIGAVVGVVEGFMRTISGAVSAFGG